MSFLFSKRDSIESTCSDGSSNASSCQESNDLDLHYLVEDVRNQLINKYIRNPEEYDSNDMVTYVEDDTYRYIERYLIRHYCNVKKTVETVDDCLKWRKSSGLSTLNDESFPELFYKYGYMYLYGVDLDGNSLLQFKAKLYHIYHPHVIDAFKEFFLHLMFKIDKISASRGKQWILFFDCTDVTIREVDISLALWALKIYHEKCPGGLEKVIFYNLPWIMRPVLNTLLSLCPKSISSLVEVVKKGKLDKYISKDNLPRHLGGHKDPRSTYPNCIDLYKFFNDRYDDITDEDISKAREKYEKIMADDHW